MRTKIVEPLIIVLILFLFFMAFAGCHVAESSEPEPPKDLGVLFPGAVIPIQRNTVIPTVVEVEALNLAESREHRGRIIRFTTTNNFLSVTNFASLFSGRILLGLKNVSGSGGESDANLYVFELRRADKPPAPSAFPVKIVWTGSENMPSDSLIPTGTREEEASWLQRALDGLERNTIPRQPPLPPQSRYFSTNIAGQRSTNFADYATPPTWNPADYTNQEPDTRVSMEVLIKPGTNDPPQARPMPGARNETYAEGQDRIADNRKRRNE